MISFKYSSQQILESGDLCHSSGECYNTNLDFSFIIPRDHFNKFADKIKVAFNERSNCVCTLEILVVCGWANRSLMDGSLNCLLITFTGQWHHIFSISAVAVANDCRYAIMQFFYSSAVRMKHSARAENSNCACWH